MASVGGLLKVIGPGDGARERKRGPKGFLRKDARLWQGRPRDMLSS